MFATLCILYFSTNDYFVMVFICHRSSRVDNPSLEEQHPSLEVSEEEEERVVDDELHRTTFDTPTPSHAYS